VLGKLLVNHIKRRVLENNICEQEHSRLGRIEFIRNPIPDCACLSIDDLELNVNRVLIRSANKSLMVCFVGYFVCLLRKYRFFHTLHRTK
jgi:hypothetical protein